ncbi:hypothetical protein DES53_102881 [Roseimicrobium gellanilyticum]|uniref:Uncharacterized protein n=1 Tax=Roseimicrobium gellanilyticum TaxID=748857 RepID=A0A366HS28_9BACT|nr:hypothetical protein [Roseimicrobium gellanilyticum]RBP46490.1 hypothetical protein DES53_102881 [Roseimicrobium gellanilyticum]
MKQFLLSIFLMTVVSSLHAADTVARIAVGMDHKESIALLKKHSAEDITPGLAIVGPNGEHPLHGLVWALRDYDAIIELAEQNGKITTLTYWTKKDFGTSKDHRARTEQNVKSLTLDPKGHAVSVEKQKEG